MMQISPGISVLFCCAAAAVGAMGWYILVGHNWNQAATHIDDMVGSMDGYTVIVYEGVVKKPKTALSNWLSAWAKPWWTASRYSASAPLTPNMYCKPPRRNWPCVKPSR